MIHKYWQFEYFFTDNVYFHTALWKLANFEAPIVSHPKLGEIHIFGDHFHPIILVVAMLLRWFPSDVTVLVTMAAAYSLGGFFGLLVGLHWLKQKWMVLVLVLSYFLYVGSQQAFLFGFHEINLMPPLFLATIWSLQKKRWVVFGVSFALFLLVKESMAIIAMALAIWLWFWGKEYRKPAIVIFCFSLAWYSVVTRLVIPQFSDGQFLYENIQPPKTLPDIYKSLFVPSGKIETFVVTMASFGFLPLLNIAALPLVLQDFLLRYVFAIPGNVQYLLQYHYGVALAPLVFASSLWTAHRLERGKMGARWLVLFAFFSLVGTLYANVFLSQRAPIFLVFNRTFYANSQNNAFLWKLIRAVPPNELVMTQNHLGLPLAKQPTHILAHNLRELLVVSPEYVAYDLRAGQNGNNWFPTSEEKWRQTVDLALSHGVYTEVGRDGDLVILQKTHSAWH